MLAVFFTFMFFLMYRQFQRSFAKFSFQEKLIFPLRAIWHTPSYNVPREDILNSSSGRQFADSVSGEHMLPSWFDASSLVNLRCDDRWQRQMAFSERVFYSFEVREDMASGE